MITLGLNGRSDGTHDPAAALVVDGEVVAFVEQERLSRVKHARGEFAHDAVRCVLDIAAIEPGEIDMVTYGWDLERYDRLRGLAPMGGPDLTRVLSGLDIEVPVRFVGHHDAHAAAAFWGSGFEKSAVVVIDAEGEDESISLYLADQRRGVRPLRRFGRGGSFGLLFRAASAYCGFGQDGAGKTMGLAAYGEARAGLLDIGFEEDELRSPFADDAGEDEIIAGWCSILSEAFGEPAGPPLCGPEGFARDQRPDAAATVQATLEGAFEALARIAEVATGSANLCMAGGVALNCVATGRLVAAGRRVHIPPATHDAGVALGSALWALAEEGCPVTEPTRADLGPAFDDSDVALAAGRSGLKVTDVDPVAEAADRLERGEIVGWFQGRMEVGPRALGRRSILAGGRDISQRDILNDRKGRERWRPVAPSLRRSDVNEFFGIDADSPFMLVSLPMTGAAAQALPAAVHEDGSARYHSTTALDGVYHDLLEEIGARHGIGSVINTSFNRRGEPLVCTPDEAFSSGSRIGLDAVIAGNLCIDLPSL